MYATGLLCVLVDFSVGREKENYYFHHEKISSERASFASDCMVTQVYLGIPWLQKGDKKCEVGGASCALCFLTGQLTLLKVYQCSA